MRVTSKKDKYGLVTRTFIWRGSIEKEIENCKKEIEKINKDLPMHKYLSEKFEREYKSKLRRLEECEAFIENAPAWIKKREEEEKTNGNNS